LHPAAVELFALSVALYWHPQYRAAAAAAAEEMSEGVRCLSQQAHAASCVNFAGSEG
jgi:hypothetical protein